MVRRTSAALAEQPDALDERCAGEKKTEIAEG
jgi:hypothetical protein